MKIGEAPVESCLDTGRVMGLDAEKRLKVVSVGISAAPLRVVKLARAAKLVEGVC